MRTIKQILEQIPGGHVRLRLRTDLPEFTYAGDNVAVAQIEHGVIYKAVQFGEVDNVDIEIDGCNLLVTMPSGIKILALSIDFDCVGTDDKIHPLFD